MKIIHSVEDVKKYVYAAKREDKTVALVPTMGYLHNGHLTLMRKAKEENDLVVASIFVNPLQFVQGEDYEVYPRDLDRDAALAESAGVDILFAPTVQDMYPQGYENMITFVDVLKVTEPLCGASRPGHFRGVATVVTKLFNIVEPHTAYFGQKDAQQVVVIQSMVRDLNMNTRVISVPIVREDDGLAMSSRNVYLNESERKAALVLSRSLGQAKEILEAGQLDCEVIRQKIRTLIEAEPLAQIDYVSICDALTLEELQVVRRPLLIALAVKIGKTRLIDNLLWEE